MKTTRSERNHVGGWLYRRVDLEAQERVIAEDRCFYRVPKWSWRLGKLFITSRRVIWSPSRDIFTSPVVILLEDVADLGVEAKSGLANLNMMNEWYIRTRYKKYLFGDSSGPFPFAPGTRRKQWLEILSQAVSAA